MSSRTVISFLLATGLHAAALAALDAGWLMPLPSHKTMTCECEVELVSVVPDKVAVPLPMAPEPAPPPAQIMEPPPAPVQQAPPAPPEPPPPAPKVEPLPDPQPEPPPPPKTERRPEPGPILESKPKPVVSAPAPTRVATAKPQSSQATGSPGGSNAGGKTTRDSGGPSSGVIGGQGTTPTLAFPAYRSNPAPAYPTQSRRHRQEGAVLLGVEVSSDGRATRVEVEVSSGHSLLDEAALKAVRRWRFEPARLGDRPVDSRVQVPIRFQLDR